MIAGKQEDEQIDFVRVTLKGTFWIYVARYSGKLIVFVSTIILARLLSKDDFGLVGYALLLTNFLDLLSDLGIGSALVYHKKDVRASDTAFWIVFLMGFLLFGITWLVSPLVGSFFSDQRAVEITRVLGITFPIVSFGYIHNTLLQKELAFDRTFIPTFARNLAKGLFSIAFALLGFGVWSLVIGHIGGAVILVLALWWVYPWRPSLRFDTKIARDLLSYGMRILSVNFLSYFLRDSDGLFVGRFIGSVALGVYTLAFRVPDILIYQFINIVGTVTFPVYVKIKKDVEKLKTAFLTATKYVAFVSVPISLGLALVARPFVLTIYTEKWIEAVPVIQAISIYALLFALPRNAGSIYKAKGRPDILTKLAVLRAIILIPAMYLAATRIGTIASVGWTHAGIALLAGTLNFVVASKMIEVPFIQLIGVLRPAILSGLIMSLAVWGTLQVSAPALPIVQLILAVGIGGIVYLIALGLQQRSLVFQVQQSMVTAFSRRGA